MKRLPGLPLVVFVHSYVLKVGSRDGPAGFHYAVARAFYYWQTAVKLRERRGTQSIAY